MTRFVLATGGIPGAGRTDAAFGPVDVPDDNSGLTKAPGCHVRDTERNTHGLATAMFAPRGIAVVGASCRQGSVGCAIVDNLLAGQPAMPIFVIDPRPVTLAGS